MSSIHSYPNIYNLGHRAVTDLLGLEVIVEEKVDGSQFSFGLDSNGKLVCRSKGVEIDPEANTNSMFSKAVETAKELAPLLQPGITLRGEYLQKPKHNALAYDRAPNKHFILFDVTVGDSTFLKRWEKELWAKTLGLEIVPLLFQGKVESLQQLEAMLDRTSILGGQKIEGVVIKPVEPIYGADKKLVIAKLVSQSFREVHAKGWKTENGGQNDILFSLGEKYKTEARWNKAVQHLTEAGVLLNEPKDIPALFKEVNLDVIKECEDEIKEALFKWAWPKISRAVTNGLPEWYRDRLNASAFDEKAA